MERSPLPPRDARGRFVNSRQKASERRDLAAFKRRRKLEPDRDPMAGVVGGASVVARAASGSAYPHPAVYRHRAQLRQDATIRATGRSLSERELVALAWFAAADLVLSGGGGVCLSWADLAALVGCRLRAAGNYGRRLVALGLVEREPHYQAIPAELRDPKAPHRQWTRAPNIYRLAPWLRALLSGSKSCQAGDRTQNATPAGFSAPLRDLPVAGASETAGASPAASSTGTCEPREAAAPATVEAGEGPPQMAPEEEGRPAQLVDALARLATALPAAGEGDAQPAGRPIAWVRLAHRLHAELTKRSEDRAGLERLRDLEARRALAAQLELAAATRERPTATAADFAARIDDDAERAVCAELVRARLAAHVLEARAQWRDAATHPARCGCAVCHARRAYQRGDL